MQNNIIFYFALIHRKQHLIILSIRLLVSTRHSLIHLSVLTGHADRGCVQSDGHRVRAGDCPDDWLRGGGVVQVCAINWRMPQTGHFHPERGIVEHCNPWTNTLKLSGYLINNNNISFRWYAFPNFCTQISRPLAYGVRTSSKASVTAALLVPSLIAKGEKIIMCSLFKPDCFLVDCFWSFTRISYRSVLKWYSFGGFCLKRI